MQNFNLEISAESPNGEAVKLETNVNIHCDKEMAVSVVVNVLKSNEHLKIIFAEALLISMADEKISENITDEQYGSYKNGPIL